MRALLWCIMASMIVTLGGESKFPLWTAGKNEAGQLGTTRGLGTTQAHVTPVRLDDGSLEGQVVVELTASAGHTIVQTIPNSTIDDVQYASRNGTHKCDPQKRRCTTWAW